MSPERDARTDVRTSSIESEGAHLADVERAALTALQVWKALDGHAGHLCRERDGVSSDQRGLDRAI